MEERVEPAVRRIEPAAKLLPGRDFVHGFVADDFFENIGGRRPFDPPQNEKAAIEPGGEQVPEVAVERVQRRAVLDCLGEGLAHLHQRERASGRMVEPADELLPRRLRAREDLGCAGGVRRFKESARRVLQRFQVRPKNLADPRKKGPLVDLAERVVALQERCRRRRARSLAASGKQLPRELDQRLYIDRRRTAQPDERAAAIGHTLPQARNISEVGAGLAHRRLALRPPF